MTSSRASATAITAGIWQDVPVDRPEFRKKYAGMMAASAKAEEAIGT